MEKGTTGMYCGMNVCKKCAVMNVIFGVLFLVSALWGSAPAWLNGWTVVGVYVLLWGLASLKGGKH